MVRKIQLCVPRAAEFSEGELVSLVTWLGPQAHKLLREVRLVEFFAGHLHLLTQRPPLAVTIAYIWESLMGRTWQRVAARRCPCCS